MRKTFYLYERPGEKRLFTVPDTWDVVHFGETKESGPLPDTGEMAVQALLEPVGTPPLEDIVAGARNVAIIVDDKTRPTPAHAILDVLLPYLENNGVPADAIAIVFAMGTHVPMNAQEVEEKLGSRVAAGYKVVQHSAWQDDLVPTKLPGNEGVVKINPAVARADVKIGISSILPHPMAGYGGGPKILMPGICNFEFVRDHHMKYTIDPRSRAGLTTGNPFHEACMRIAEAIGLDFSINCVYDQQARLVSIMGGSLRGAFSKAVDLCSQTLGYSFDEKVDITITSTYPHTHGHQFCKGLSAPDLITNDTGSVLMYVPLAVPVLKEFVTSFNVVRERSHNDSPSFVRAAMSKGMPFLPEKPVEFNMAMSCVILRPPIRTMLVSPLISKQEAADMGLDYTVSLDEGIRSLEKAYPEAKVAIFPAGGLIVPVDNEKRQA